MKTIALVFICRDNEGVIGQMIESCAPIVDCVVAVDTGSKDNTILVIEKTCKELKLPLHLCEDKWRNFGHNRSLMMQHAKHKADYSFVMDSDEILEIDEKFDRKSLSGDVIMVRTDGGGYYYYRDRIFRNALNWKWIGAAHEFAHTDMGFGPKQIAYGLLLKLRPKTGNSHIQRNYDLLLQDYEKNPADSRTLFYLGESSHDLGNYDKAIDYYTRRTKITYYPEEQWYAAYKIGMCYWAKKEFDNAENAFLRAYGMRPTRMEPMYQLAKMTADKGDHARAIAFYQTALNIKTPKDDKLFVQSSFYDYYCEFWYCISLYYAGQYELCFEIGEKFAEEKKDIMPASLYDRHLKNIMFCERVLIEKGWKERFVIAPADMRYDGLGDNLLHSHLAGLAKKQGFKKVYLSSLMKFKTPGTAEIVYLNNPDVDGSIERYGVKDQDPYATGLLHGRNIIPEMETMKQIAVSFGFYNEGETYRPIMFPAGLDQYFTGKIEGVIFDGHGKHDIVSEDKVHDYFAKFGPPSWQITFENTDSDVHHQNTRLKRILLPGVPELSIPDINAYEQVLRHAEKVICLTSATSIAMGQWPEKECIVLTDTIWLNRQYRTMIRKTNTYINLDEI